MKDAQRGFGVLFIMAIIAALLIGGAVFWHIQSKNPSPIVTTIFQKITPSQITNSSWAGTPPQPTNGGTSNTSNTSNISSVPISQRTFSGGIIRYSIPVTIGGKTITAMLDTGSTGLRILDSALPAGGYTPSSAPSSASYAGGQIVKGIIAQATVTIGGTPIDTPFEVIHSISCNASHPGCNTSSIFGYDAIIGIGMRGQDVPNPLARTQSERWILTIPTPGSVALGELILNPTDADAAGYATVQLPSETGGWSSNQIPICVNRSDTGESVCAGGSIDTGAFNVRAIPAGSAAAWPAGTHASIIIKTDSSNLTDDFTVGSTPGTNVFLDATSAQNARNLNTGPLPYFTYSALYDFSRGTISLKQR